MKKGDTARLAQLVLRQGSSVTASRAQVGRATPCAAAGPALAVEPANCPPVLSAAGISGPLERRTLPAASQRIPVAVIALGAETWRSLERLLEAADGIRIAGSFANIEAAESELLRARAWVVLIGEGSSLFPRASIRKLGFLAPKLAVVMRSPDSRPASIFSSLVAGAVGYVVKTALPDQLTLAIAEAAQGRVFLCRQAEWEAHEHLRRISSEAGRNVLTKRQMQICIWLLSVQEKYVACGLNLALNTVHAHIKAIYRSLGVHGRKGLQELLGGAP